MARKGVLTGVLLTVLVLLAALLFLLLPFAAERYVLPRIAARLPFAHAELHLARVSPWRASGSLFLMDDDGQGIRVPRLVISYRPGGLLAGEIEAVVIEGLRLDLEEEGGGLRLAGLKPDREESGGAMADGPLRLPVAVERVSVNNATIAYHGARQLPDLSFSAELDMDYAAAGGQGKRVSKAQAHIRGGGMLPFTGEFGYTPGSDGGRISYALQSGALAEAARIFAGQADLRLAGRLVLEGDIETEGLSRLRRYEGLGTIEKFRLEHGAIALAGSADSPLQLAVSGTPGEADISLTGLRLIAPEPVGISFQGGYDIAKGHLDGRAVMRPERTGSKLSVNIEGQTVPALDLNYALEGEGFHLENGLEVAPFSAQGTFSSDNDELTAVLRASLPEVKDTARGIAVKGISLDLPFSSPEPAPGVVTPGNLFVENIVYKETSVGRLDGAVSLSTAGLAYSGQLSTPLNEGMKLTCSGEAGLGPAFSLDCVLPPVAVSAAQLRQVLPLPEKLDFQGTIAAEARLGLRDGRPSGQARISCEGGSLDFGDYKASGIATEVVLPELPAIRSAAGQALIIENLVLGRIKMSDAVLHFRLDDAETLFVERAKLAWCGGRVETAGLMITKDMRKLDATLYCDRLGFTDLLGQLGIGDASGEGSLNGRLPVRISRSDIEFDHGFLFSTPGQSGIVKFNDTEQFRRGMGDASRSVYLEYSLAALENFSYNWTKLTFNTEGEDLLLALQLDGKPAEPLAYGYREGRIVKDGEGSGLQHPIRLDVNFRLPLQDLFRYGKNIQAIMENM